MGSQILEGIGSSRFLKFHLGLHQGTLAKSGDVFVTTGKDGVTGI